MDSRQPRAVYVNGQKHASGLKDAAVTCECSPAQVYQAIMLGKYCNGFHVSFEPNKIKRTRKAGEPLMPNARTNRN